VATIPGSFFFSPTGGHVGALTQWSFQRQEGTLVVASTAQARPRTVAEKVSFFAFSKDGAWIGYVSDGVLRVEPADGGDAKEIAKEVSTFELSPDGKSLLARKKMVAGGHLLLAHHGTSTEPPKVLAPQVSEYHWSPDGARFAYTARSEEGGNDLYVATVEGNARQVGKGVPSFVFSPTGRHLAFLGDTSVRKQFGDLFVLVGGAEEATKLGETVTEFAFAASDDRIAWLDSYDPQSRGGQLKWKDVTAEGEPVSIAHDVPSFVWSKDGANLAYIRRVHQPIYSIDLFLARLGQGEPEIFTIAKGVFGYSFSSDGERLFLRTECIRNGRSCELYSVRTADPAASIQHIAGGIHTYEPDPLDESVLMITYARMDSDTFDLGVVPADGSGSVRRIDRMVLPGTRLLVGKDEVSITYAVVEAGRQGVYVADVPEFQGKGR
jgi:dipeptidyl aminopeptidase/acylaminoacyl peptidase